MSYISLINRSETPQRFQLSFSKPVEKRMVQAAKPVDLATIQFLPDDPTEIWVALQPSAHVRVRIDDLDYILGVEEFPVPWEPEESGTDNTVDR